MSSSSNEPQLKLNIFALPNQTAIIFGLIVTALLGTVCAGSIDPSPILIWPLALGLLLLPLRAFLTRPERDFARYCLAPVGNELSDLEQVIAEQACKIGLGRVPKLLISPGAEPKQPYTFGTFRRWYIAFNHKAAHKWQKDLANPEIAPVAQAKIIHELYHFKTGDYWQLGYAGELLSTTFRFMAWALAFFFGYGLFLIVVGLEIIQTNPSDWVNQIDGLTPEMRQVFIQMLPSSSEVEEVRQKAAEINLGLVITFAINATLPFVIVGLILKLLYWPKLWRTREFYADAGVVKEQQETAPFLSALTKIPLSLLKIGWSSSERHQKSSQPKMKLRDRIGRGREAIWTLRDTHPKGAIRIANVKDPTRIFGTWIDVAILVGSFTLLMDFVLAGSLTLFYVGQWPIHLPTLVAFTLISLSFIPNLVQGKATWPDMLKIVIIVVILRLCLLIGIIGLLTLLLIFDPDTLLVILNAGTASTARFAGYLFGDELAFQANNLSTFVVEASITNIAQVFIILFVLTLTLGLTSVLLRRLLTWYTFPRADRYLMKVAYLVIALIGLIIALIILPFFTIPLLRPDDILSLFSITIIGSGLAIAAIGFGLFFYADRRYAQRCPACKEVVPGSYKLGKRCCSCKELLHLWLIVKYQL